ncbi:MAG TPA: DNA methylase [Anaerolineae bacterium]|nr:DNA methylase [Anaerolineae bacterium]
MPHQPELLPDKPSPEQATRDAERAEYLERLREKLKDPEFRAIEGFPIGDDEAILALSDPPYYTACPNPFLSEIIERWQAERAQLREELGLPDDSADNGDGGEPVYHREPFAADVSEGKNDPIYNAHSYHTKVPHKAVMRYILHYTDPGDIIFDGFCGTGMTGVAAQLCGDKRTVESLGYRVKDDGTILDEKGQAISRLGARKAVLVDLSPAATFIAYNYNTPVDVAAFEREAKRILREVEEECGWMYETLHTDGRTKGRINYTVWSDVFYCSNCSGEIVFWDAIMDPVTKHRKSRDTLVCPHCSASQKVRKLERAMDSVVDRGTGKAVRFSKQIPVLINYTVGQSRFEKKPDESDQRLIERIAEEASSAARAWFPTDRMPDGLRHTKDAYYLRGIENVHHFYSDRNLVAYAYMWSQVSNTPQSIKPFLRFWLQSVALGFTKLNRFFASSYSQVNRYLKGTLYVAPVIAEVSPGYALAGKIRRLSKMRYARTDTVAIATCSASDSRVPANSVDYIFVDPPFGRNLMYGELNYIWESWLKVLTKRKDEAIIDETQAKLLPDYQTAMRDCFAEMFRVLKPGRWMTVEFHNSKNSIWNAIQEAILSVGFVIADVRVLDKQQITMQQWVGTNVVSQDLIISAYKPRTGFERRFLEQAGSEEGAWAFVRQHLEQLPIVVEQDGALEVVAERQAYLLYDRMVAFHIQRGFSVPLGAAEFYAGLKQRFPERDGMYFLPHQVAEYDRRRLRADKVEQLALFVTDEKSAVQWLRQELDSATGSGPQTYQDLQPKFLRELHKARHEALPELSEMLAQNFLKDEQDRWYVPDPARQEDLEKLRERSLLREFQEYAQGKGRLRVFRTEAVRAGFKHAWHERDYRLIIKVAERLPESVLQEDASLLMYYDNALMRAESEPAQERLL